MGLEMAGAEIAPLSNICIRLLGRSLTRMLLFINKCNTCFHNSNKKMLEGTILAPGIFSTHVLNLQKSDQLKKIEGKSMFMFRSARLHALEWLVSHIQL